MVSIVFISRITIPFNSFHFHFMLNTHTVKRNIAEDLESTRIHDAPELPDVSIVLPSKPPKIIVDEVKSPYFNQIKKIAEEDPASTTSSSISSNMPNTSSASSGPRSTRKARNRKPIKISYTDSEVSDEGDAFQTDDDDDGEWKGAESVSSESESDSDDDFKPSTRGRGCTKKTTTTETKAAVKPNAGAKSKRANMLKDDDQMVFLDLTHAEVIEVDENYKPADVTGTLIKTGPFNNLILTNNFFYIYRRQLN